MKEEELLGIKKKFEKVNIRSPREREDMHRPGQSQEIGEGSISSCAGLRGAVVANFITKLERGNNRNKTAVYTDGK